MDNLLTQLQTALTPIALAAATAFIGWLFTALRSHLHMSATASAEASIRNAAATEAGKLTATVPAASAAAVVASPTTSVASLFSADQIKTAANKVVADLPAEIKLTGYSATDIFDMILSNLPALLGAVNPALGAGAAVVATVVKDVVNKP